MCLKTITKTYIPPQEGEIVAWKLVNKITRGDHSEYWAPFYVVKFTSQWLNAQFTGYRIYTGELFYSPGFYTFVTKAGADKALQTLREIPTSNPYPYLVVIPVKINQILYEGTDATNRNIAALDIPTYVSNKIRLLTPEEASTCLI